MAGGDLLYIFAFIILPTAVLVSCIWALIMLRKGALLPPRPGVTREVDPAEDDNAMHHEMSLVEETGEHVIVEPALAARTAAPTPVVTAPVTETAPAAQYSSDANVVVPPAAASLVNRPPANVRPVDEPPAVEQTQELDVVPENAAEPVEAQRQAVVAGEPVENAGVDAPPDAETTQTAEPPGVLMVPLDEPARWSGAQTASPTGPATTEPAEDEPEAPPVTLTTPRRPARRVAQLRPTEAEPSRPRPRAGQRRGERRVEGE